MRQANARLGRPRFRLALLRAWRGSTGRSTFLDLHESIQDVCGWEHAHLLAFREQNGSVVAGVPDDLGFGSPDPDAAKVPAPN